MDECTVGPDKDRHPTRGTTGSPRALHGLDREVRDLHALLTESRAHLVFDLFVGELACPIAKRSRSAHARVLVPRGRFGQAAMWHVPGYSPVGTQPKHERAVRRMIHGVSYLEVQRRVADDPHPACDGAVDMEDETRGI